MLTTFGNDVVTQGRGGGWGCLIYLSPAINVTAALVLILESLGSNPNVLTTFGNDVVTRNNGNAGTTLTSY